MPKITVFVSFDLEFKKTITKAQLKRLEEGGNIDEIVDESEAYKLLSSDGECWMEWAPVFVKKFPKKTKKRKAKR
jgi:hypothetical protein